MRLFLCLLLFGSGSVSFANEKKFVIPDRREFPLSSQVNPCDDFHKYVCDTVESSFELPENRSVHMFAFGDSSERLLESKKKFMINILKESKLSDRSQQIRDYYKACMDTNSRPVEEKGEVKFRIQKIQSAKSAQDLARISIEGMKKGAGSLLGVYPSNNADNPKLMDLGVGGDLLNLPDNKYYENEELMKEYQDLVALFFTATGQEKNSKAAQARAAAVVEFEKRSVKNYPEAAVRRQRYSEKRQMSQVDFQAKYPLFELASIFKLVPDSTLLNIPIPEGLDAIHAALADNDLKVFKDHFAYSTLKDYMDQAYPKFFKSKFEFDRKYFGGPAVRPDLQERCTQRTMGSFAKEVDQILIDRLFPNFRPEKVKELGAKIRQSIVAGIEKNKWLSPSAKDQAAKKIQKAKLFLVMPENEEQWDFLPIKKYSPKFSIKNSQLRGEVQFDKNIASVNKPANLEKWDMGPLTVNAYYSAEENKFVMPLGILQYPFYSETLSLEENLAAVGAVMGHELGHSIDDQGSKYDSDGRLNSWMSMQDLSEFSKRGQRLVEQFNKAGFDGRLTLGENVADNVGLSFAFQAAFPDGKGSAEQKKKFFVSYARVWCVVARPQFIDLMKKTNPHAMGYARINEQVKHQPGFSEAFQCKSGDAMNLPESERVRIWL